ncbi:Restriction endonuclease EcoRV [Candidatus Promineifilum breve]|uniref:Restriction endonuclease EcoRV n=1 Tax=Candidatus Promineifilum breve TaxID=1806508 RepID=A0A160T8S3_9CHLR|nr:type II restriction endonuclease [Candidatus Promineifilum breve]CUS06149.1 Restriction endonuclease EcoRV [Candidatus Promineifilum breve]
MNKHEFLQRLQVEMDSFNRAVSTAQGDWVVKGFIDVARNIYTISTDTKVVSKVMELLLFPELVRFAQENNLKLHLAEQQNFYPDVTFIDEENHLFAVDLKSTYRVNSVRTNGMTLGAFTGYFRTRGSKKNCSFPYEDYTGHFVLGVIYSPVYGVDERRRYSLDDLELISSVITDFQFYAQEKFRIASDRPGSGNTKNIGSVLGIQDLIAGTGPFNELGEEIFNDYWMYFLTADMARAAELPNRPYTNLQTYRIYKGVGK